MTNIDRAARIIERFLPPLPGSLGAMQAEKTARALADAGLLATEPRIIRTRDELASLDPDTLVTLALPEHDKWPSPLVQAWPAPVAYRLDLTWSGPIVIIATGDQVRAARQTLESTDAVD